MSRTWHHSKYRRITDGITYMKWVRSEETGYLYKVLTYEAEVRPNTYYHRGGQKVLREDHWPYNEPKWWRKIHKHRARRNEWRKCYSKIKKGYDLDNMVYPMDKKPWVYYW